MKAKFVYETINFERGGNTLDRIGVGLPYQRALKDMKGGFEELNQEYGIKGNIIIEEGEPYKTVECATATWFFFNSSFRYSFKIEYIPGWAHKTPISVYKKLDFGDYHGKNNISMERAFEQIREWLKEFGFKI